MLRAAAEYELLVCSRDAQLRMRTNAKLSRTNSLDQLANHRDRRTSRPTRPMNPRWTTPAPLLPQGQ